MSIAENISLLRWSAHYEGWPFTVLRVLVKATAIPGTQGLRSTWLQRLSERRFDSRFNVQTSGLVTPEELQLPDGLKEHAIEYCPTSASRFGWLLSKLPVDLSEYVFVDFGSGKGRVLLMASEFPFQQVRGVELSHELHNTAMQNIRRFRSRRRQCEDVDSVNQDATEFKFPLAPLVLFFFNPFSAEILERVIKNLQASIREEPRHVICIYYNALHTCVFEECPIFREVTSDFHPGVDWKIYTTQAGVSGSCDGGNTLVTMNS